MFKSILVVCAGNICRSPIGEAMLAAGLPGKVVSSAGIVAKNDMPADPSSVQLCSSAGIPIDSHKARRLTPEICAENDLILVMEPQHVKDVAERFPQASGKTMLIGKWIGVDEIPDPHRQQMEAFEHAYQLLEKACEGWVAKLA
ncbi:low molecular weight protein-tyrosine-phosphatase [Umboniibacter marinipuniceus]|uniref:protein-tyrosine-phosphatase n=1 Tax=Umboniibacter marinipuniceus TaxID=569599 RepID=A0A3M0A439_9GAMM|nr:low molecular weight protein-tyrosine-phosphatase [Umboniibacter marinipuniceus]RMA79550.1 protein-tyrosine phosphatase [Umboniibacter marinipuniceus]